MIFENYYYIYNGKVIKCKKTGHIKPVETNFDNVSMGQSLQNETAEFDSLYHYNENMMDQNVETKEFIRASYYSTELHKRFGEFLRNVRDLYDLNLMGMYNCFDYEIFQDVYIGYNSINNEYNLINGKDSTKKILAIPIKFNKKYTVAIQSDKQLFVAPILKLPNNFEFFDSSNDNLKITQINKSSFYSPFEISFDLNETQGDLYKYEQYLYMIIQIDSNNNSSVVVLEDVNQGFNIISVDEQSNFESSINQIYKPKLLQINDGISYAYSNTIIQYLLHNVIDNIDNTPGNITYVKNLMGVENKSNYWENTLKYSAFLKYLLNLKQEQKTDEYGYIIQNLNELKKDCEDVTGYIDTQIEKWLNT